MFGWKITIMKKCMCIHRCLLNKHTLYDIMKLHFYFVSRAMISDFNSVHALFILFIPLSNVFWIMSLPILRTENIHHCAKSKPRAKCANAWRESYWYALLFHLINLERAKSPSMFCRRRLRERANSRHFIIFFCSFCLQDWILRRKFAFVLALFHATLIVLARYSLGK